MQAHDGMWFTFLCVSDLLFVMVTLVEAAGLTLLMCHFLTKDLEILVLTHQSIKSTTIFGIYLLIFHSSSCIYVTFTLTLVTRQVILACVYCKCGVCKIQLFHISTGIYINIYKYIYIYIYIIYIIYIYYI